MNYVCQFRKFFSRFNIINKEIKKQFDKVKKERLINHILETGADHTQKELNKWSKKRLCIWVLWDMCATIYDSEEYQDEESEDD